MAAGRIILEPTGTLTSSAITSASILLGPGVVTYRCGRVNGKDRWTSYPLTAVRRIEWDDSPVDAEPAGDEIDYLRQFIANLSPDELEAAVESLIGVGGQDKLGEWIKTALMQMVEAP